MVSAEKMMKENAYWFDYLRNKDLGKIKIYLEYKGKQI